MELKKQFSAKALNDFALINSAVNEKNEKSYALLMENYKKSVYYSILKMVRNVDDAEDLTIEAFTKAFKNLHKFKKNYTFSTWLFKIATNNTIDFIRKRRLETTSINSFYTNDKGFSINIDFPDKEPNPQEKAIKVQKKEFIQLFVTKLPTKYRRLVRLRYFDELSYAEITKELGTPLGTVKAQLHRARELLFQLVKKNNEEYI